MLTTLRDYYKAKGIAAEGLDCPRQASCRSLSKDFVTARELFVSIDASSDHPGRAPSQRTLEYMRYWEENGKSPPHGCNVDFLSKNSHWYRTHEFTCDILLRTAMARGVSPFRLGDVHRYFAHTNSAKCKDAGRETGQGPALVFDNCRPFIAPEVQLLRPPVLRFRLFHSRAFGRFNKQRREAYAWYSAVATAFFEGGPEAAASVREA